MRIALFFVAFTLGAGLALGLDAADAATRHREQQEQQLGPQGQTLSVEVPATPENSGGEIDVLPVRWQGEPVASTHRSTSPSGWRPGAGELVLAVVAVGTLGTGLVVRRRVLVPIRA